MVVDATQGVQAQTLANVYLAVDNDLALLPVINKVDLPSAMPEREQKEAEIARLRRVVLPPSEALNRLLVSRETSPLSTGIRMDELLRRPQIGYADLAPFDEGRPALPPDVVQKVEVEIQYEGYLKRQEAQIRKLRRLEEKKLPPDLDYAAVTGLREEAREKLAALRPLSVGQAAGISGVNPADVTVLLIYLEKEGKG